jgi:hypothetical protein
MCLRWCSQIVQPSGLKMENIEKFDHRGPIRDELLLPSQKMSRMTSSIPKASDWVHGLTLDVVEMMWSLLSGRDQLTRVCHVCRAWNKLNRGGYGWSHDHMNNAFDLNQLIGSRQGSLWLPLLGERLHHTHTLIVNDIDPAALYGLSTKPFQGHLRHLHLSQNVGITKDNRDAIQLALQQLHQVTSLTLTNWSTPSSLLSPSLTSLHLHFTYTTWLPIDTTRVWTALRSLKLTGLWHFTRPHGSTISVPYLRSITTLTMLQSSLSDHIPYLYLLEAISGSVQEVILSHCSHDMLQSLNCMSQLQRLDIKQDSNCMEKLLSDFPCRLTHLGLMLPTSSSRLNRLHPVWSQLHSLTIYEARRKPLRWLRKNIDALPSLHECTVVNDHIHLHRTFDRRSIRDGTMKRTFKLASNHDEPPIIVLTGSKTLASSSCSRNRENHWSNMTRSLSSLSHNSTNTLIFGSIFSYFDVPTKWFIIERVCSRWREASIKYGCGWQKVDIPSTSMPPSPSSSSSSSFIAGLPNPSWIAVIGRHRLARVRQMILRHQTWYGISLIRILQHLPRLTSLSLHSDLDMPSSFESFSPYLTKLVLSMKKVGASWRMDGVPQSLRSLSLTFEDHCYDDYLVTNLDKSKPGHVPRLIIDESYSSLTSLQLHGWWQSVWSPSSSTTTPITMSLRQLTITMSPDPIDDGVEKGIAAFLHSILSPASSIALSPNSGGGGGVVLPFLRDLRLPDITTMEWLCPLLEHLTQLQRLELGKINKNLTQGLRGLKRLTSLGWLEHGHRHSSSSFMTEFIPMLPLLEEVHIYGAVMILHVAMVMEPFVSLEPSLSKAKCSRLRVLHLDRARYGAQNDDNHILRTLELPVDWRRSISVTEFAMFLLETRSKVYGDFDIDTHNVINEINEINSRGLA